MTTNVNCVLLCLRQHLQSELSWPIETPESSFTRPANLPSINSPLLSSGAKIGACSVVLTDVPPHTTAVGNPARLMGGPKNPTQLKEVPSESMDHTSFIEDWSDYII